MEADINKFQQKAMVDGNPNKGSSNNKDDDKMNKEMEDTIV